MTSGLWVEKYRPATLDTYLGNPNLIKDLEMWIANNDFPNLMFYGSPGIGKTTAAKLIVGNIKCDSTYINCSDKNGIGTIRDEVKSFASAASFNPIKVVILDESDFLTSEAQAALRNIIETYSGNTRFIFTCNFINRIIDPLQSRLCLYELSSPKKEEIAMFCKNILDQENIKYNLPDVVEIVKKLYPDIRKTVNLLQRCSARKTLIIDTKLFNTSTIAIEITNIIRESHKGNASREAVKPIPSIRQIIADNNIKDFTEIYRAFYDNFIGTKSTVIIADYLQKSITAPDKEICFMACVSKLLDLSN
jgi:replication factor C small subunit